MALLEMAAISLITVTRDRFTEPELVAEAKRYAGPELPVLDLDLQLVIRNAGFLKKRGNALTLR